MCVLPRACVCLCACASLDRVTVTAFLARLQARKGVVSCLVYPPRYKNTPLARRAEQRDRLRPATRRDVPLPRPSANAPRFHTASGHRRKRRSKTIQLKNATAGPGARPESVTMAGWTPASVMRSTGQPFGRTSPVHLSQYRTISNKPSNGKPPDDLRP